MLYAGSSLNDLVPEFENGLQERAGTAPSFQSGPVLTRMERYRATRSVTFTRPPFGKSIEEPDRIRSTPW